MFYDRELDFMIRVFKKYNLSVITFDPTVPMQGIVGADLLRLVGMDIQTTSFSEAVGGIEEHTFYRITDLFQCHYIFLKLPNPQEDSLLLIGPYGTEEVTRELILERTESLNLTAAQTAQLEKFYRNIPIIPEDSRLFTVVDAFCDVIWEGEENAYVNINKNDDLPFASLSLSGEDFEVKDPVLERELMEKRYAFENQIIDAVAHGQAYKAEVFFSAFKPAAFEQRLPDTLRNAKNYMIIMNTLLRKAAEQGGVHPLYLDKISSEYARDIENFKSAKMVPYFMKKIFEDYCKLVNKHNTKNYSALVKNVVLYIESDLSADLSLKELAELNGVSASYLSTCFKKETGKSFVEYVNSKRISMAKHLLKTTKLQIQTIAQQCGFLDMQYFSKVFKKYTKKTPREYREFSQ